MCGVVMGNNGKTYLTLQEVADDLSVDYKTIYRLVTAGKIPAVKIGSQYRVGRHELDDYLNASRVAQKGKHEVEICAGCGKELVVASSVAERLKDTGEPLCHSCARLDRSKIATQPAEEAKVTPHQDINPANEYESVLENNRELLSRHAAMESAFLARLESNLYDLKQINHPESGKRLNTRIALQAPERQRAFEHRTLQKLFSMESSELTLMQRAANNKRLPLPRNECRIYTISEPQGKNDGLRVAAQFWSPLDSLRENKAPDQPLGLEETRRLIQSHAEVFKSAPYQHVLGIGSPTGFTREALQLVQGNESKWKIIVPKVLFLLVDLAEIMVYLFADKRRWEPAGDLFSFETRNEQAKKHVGALRGLLQTNQSMSQAEVGSKMGLLPDKAAELMNTLVEQERSLDLMRLGDGELIIFKK
jgi:excisionase family DNA binding protein